MSNGAIAIVAIILIALLFFSGPIIAFVSSLPQIIQDWIAQLRGSLPGAGGDIRGAVGVSFKLTMADGSVKEFNQDLSYSIMPLSITLDNTPPPVNVIHNIAILINAKLTAVNSWHSSTVMQVELYKKDDSTPLTSSSATYPASGASWSSGDIKTLAQTNFPASTLESIVSQYGGNTHYLLQVTASVDLTVTASDGAQITLHASTVAAGIDITYHDNLPTSLSIVAPSQTLTP